MRLKLLKVLLSASLAALIVWVFLWEHERTLAPPLSRAHAQARELRGRKGCAVCHGETHGPLAMQTACIACHQEVGDDVALGVGLHGQLPAEKSSDCANCHTEHAGAEFPLVRTQSFRLAGFAKRAEYDHRGLSYRLAGAHDRLDCIDCHPRAEVAFLEKGSQRFRGLRQECIGCHEDPHGGQMLADCASCHGQTEAFAKAPDFVHPSRFALQGGHAGLDCQRCHAPASPYSIEAVGGSVPPPDRSCTDCHPNGHTSVFLREVAAFEQASDCGACHDPSAGGWNQAAGRFDAAWHLASGFSLQEPHAGLACSACHAAPVLGETAELAWARRFPGRSEHDCKACHADPHEGQFVEGAFAQANCAVCHPGPHFLPAHFGFAEHAQTGFALEASHRAVACEACHKDSSLASASRVPWSGVARACDACHADAHLGAFNGLATLDVFGGERECARCHDATSFAKIRQSGFDHGLFTPFALTGAHQSAACEACHKPQEPDDNGRRFGWIAASFGAPWQASKPCSLCHADPHGGRFDQASLPEQIAGLRDCARCHGETDWARIEREPFDHGLWTGSALEGAHATAQCKACHVPTLESDDAGRRFGDIAAMYGTGEPTCSQCHPDPHFQIFESVALPAQVEGRRDCERCHTQTSFDVLRSQTFDHDFWTQSNLRSGHAQQSCDDCHPKLIEKGRRGRGRTPPAGRSCSDCHADPHLGQFGKPKYASCADCHRSQADFAVLAFDHNRDSDFALDAIHEPLACSACHKPAKLSSGIEAIRYKPLGTQCIDCHVPGGKLQGERR